MGEPGCSSSPCGFTVISNQNAQTELTLAQACHVIVAEESGLLEAAKNLAKCMKPVISKPPTNRRPKVAVAVETTAQFPTVDTASDSNAVDTHMCRSGGTRPVTSQYADQADLPGHQQSTAR